LLRKKRDRARSAVFVVVFKKDTEHEQKSSISNVLLQRHWEGKAALWLNPMNAKTPQCLASETQEKRAVRLNKTSY